MGHLLVEHWRRLTGTVHPDDEPVLRARPHRFNLDFPPPAFLGDVVNAPVILLFANGGYDAVLTAEQFADPAAVDAHLRRLHRAEAPELTEIAAYYATKAYSGWLASGDVAIVNAVAYRSPRLSTERDNWRIIPHLPSYGVHRRWMIEQLLPEVSGEERLVVVHRNGLWKIDRARAPKGVLFSPAPASPHLSRSTVRSIQDFLDARA